VSTLLVASTGGHLKQLHRLHRRLVPEGHPVVWVTFRTAQSVSLLEGEDVFFVPFVGGRDPKGILKNLPAAARVLRERPVSRMVSTGSAIALPYFALARTRRIQSHYIESSARSQGPSATGRLISRLPGVHLYTQYPAWAGGPWRFAGSVFDSFEAAPAGPPQTIRRAVVSLGTFRGIGFERLVRRVIALLPADVEVLWQTGDTDVSDLGIAGRREIPDKELMDAMRDADVVIAHAGVGTALAALEVGKRPILVPRRLQHAEHVDDHQTQIAGELQRRGLALSVEADELQYRHLLEAARSRTRTLPEDPPFNLRR
jgi:UDP-N-acetylglucosamine--N-acetylmuramyl-(pentapeptide) pyrophosphoryl-undecaprenol N-acetylglucosamine transferase